MCVCSRAWVVGPSCIYIFCIRVNVHLATLSPFLCLFFFSTGGFLSGLILSSRLSLTPGATRHEICLSGLKRVVFFVVLERVATVLATSPFLVEEGSQIALLRACASFL